jgi:hypothetical protein
MLAVAVLLFSRGDGSTHISASVFPLTTGARLVLSFDDPPVDAAWRPQNWGRWLVVEGPPGITETTFQAAEVDRLRATGWTVARVKPIPVVANERHRKLNLEMASGASAGAENRAGRFPMPSEAEQALRRFGGRGRPLLAVDIYRP